MTALFSWHKFEPTKNDPTFKSIRILNETVGLIQDSSILVKFGLEPDNLLGGFQAEKLQSLLRFCSKNPKYHIISVTEPNCKVNRVVESSFRFMLGDGDRNPGLVLRHSDEFTKKASAFAAYLIRTY